jgi:hypothetical protein
MTLKQELEQLMSNLPPSIDKLDVKSFTGYSQNWTTTYEPYIQHIPKLIDDIQYQFLKICDRELNTNYFTKNYDSDKPHRQGIVGRFIDDSYNKDLSQTWYRFMCIDEKYREWPQPYYAINAKELFDTDFDENTNRGLPQKGYCVNDNNSELIEWFRDYKLNEILE